MVCKMSLPTTGELSTGVKPLSLQGILPFSIMKKGKIIYNLKHKFSIVYQGIDINTK